MYYLCLKINKDMKPVEQLLSSKQKLELEFTRLLDEFSKEHTNSQCDFNIEVVADKSLNRTVIKHVSIKLTL